MIENLRAAFQTFQKDPEMICKIFNRRLINPIRAFLEGKSAEEIQAYREGKELMPDDEQNIYNLYEAEEWIKTQDALHNPEKIGGEEPIKVNYLEGHIHICKFNKLTFLYDKKDGRTGLYMNYPAGFLSKAVWDDDGNFELVVLTGMHPSEKKLQKIVLDWFEKSREAEAQIRGRWLLQNLGVTDTDKHPFLTLDSDFEAFEPDQDYNEEQSQKDPRRNMLTEIKAPGFEDKLIVALKLEELWHNRMKKHELVYLLKNTDISISALRGYLHKNRYKYSSKHWNVLGEDMPWFSVKDYNRCTDFSFYEQRGNILNSY